MTTIKDLLGEQADILAKSSIAIGDVHLLPLGRGEGITPKNGDSKAKFFVVLGFDGVGNIIGGIVINSKINHKLPNSITDYLMPISKKSCPFLDYDSFANCSHLVVVSKAKFNSSTYKGRIEDENTMEQIVGTLSESPYVSKQQLREFGIIK